ncbi:MAG: guanylate kinase [Bacillota bacterium]
MISIIVFIGPSGSGKTTLSKKMNIKKVTTYTSRPMRKNEKDGVDYFFVDRQELLDLFREGELLEYTEYNGHLYGTGIKPLKDAISRGEVLTIAVDINGARRLLEVFSENLLIIGIDSPLEECIKRMEERGEPEIENRTASLVDEINAVRRMSHIVINNSKDNWDKSLLIVEAIGRGIGSASEE